jgi:hypothetical protein
MELPPGTAPSFVPVAVDEAGGFSPGVAAVAASLTAAEGWVWTVVFSVPVAAEFVSAATVSDGVAASELFASAEADFFAAAGVLE